MKKNLSNVLLIVIFFTGLAILLYPPVSSWWNAAHQTRQVEQYQELVSMLDSEECRQIFQEAQNYNARLCQRGMIWHMTEEETDEYFSSLNVPLSSMIGHIEIPRISCNLPIYHGTSNAVLQAGVGHIAGSSLPVGGESSHCLLSGHRGLPSSKLFTDLNQLEEGDHFMLHIMNETLTYEVDQIRIVLPDEIDMFRIEEGKDYCTLVTCTPYGINTHRLLVRGVRVENDQPILEIVTEAYELDPIILAPAVALPVMAVVIYLMIRTPKKKNKAGKQKS